MRARGESIFYVDWIRGMLVCNNSLLHLTIHGATHRSNHQPVHMTEVMILIQAPLERVAKRTICPNPKATSSPPSAR